MTVSDLEKKFTSKCEFVASADTLDWLPPLGIPEVAFAGRSNVGKSTLINALTARKKLARTSNTPGRTQQLNFFNIGDMFQLVDMPGYGYAKVSKSKIKNWVKVLENYLKGRSTLRLTLILVDARHGLKDADRDMMDLLNKAAVPYRIVLTKADKANKSEINKTVEAIESALKKNPAAFPHPHVTSSDKKQGLEELREIIFNAVQ
jgi:GTP-binding protein